MGARRRAAGLAAACGLVASTLALVSPSAAGAGTPPPPPVTMYATDVAAGQDFACAVQTDATLACWGQNGYGQMGFGHKPYSLVGKRAFSVRGALSVATGWDHTCVVLATRQVTCLGRDSRGQLGAPSRQPDQWVEGPTIDHLTSVLALTAGYQHSCALVASHRVLCWGADGFGQLGDGRYQDSSRPRFVLSPRGGAPLRGVTAIAAGADDTCALLADGQVWCWGLNSSGQLGQAPPLVRVDRPRHVNVAHVVALAAGYLQTCAVRSSGVVQCWGDNDLGQLGVSRQLEVSPAPRVVQGVRRAIGVSAGFDHSCALLAGGHVRCWGADNEGQLGDGRTGTSFGAVTVVGIAGATSLASGYWFSCARLDSGLVRCWGLGLQGQLGVGSRRSVSAPAHDVLVRSLSSG